MLRVENLHVHYGRIAALHGIHVEVQEGEIVSVVGPNGAGKSSLLNTISGAVKPSGGNVTFAGENITGAAPESIVRKGISMVPEGRRIFTKLTVAENLMLGYSTRKRSPEVDADLESVFDLFPILRTYHDRSAGMLSGGEQQMLAIGRALLARPRLLLLDEPSLGLAPIIIDAVFDTILRLQTMGVTVLLVEQNVMRAIDLADRTYVLRTGSIEMSGARDEIGTHDGLEAAFLGFDVTLLDRDESPSD